MPVRPLVRFLSVLFLALVGDGAAGAQHRPARQPIAMVAGQPIYDDELAPFIEPQLFQLRLQEHELKSRALDTLVNQRLLEADARRKGIPSANLIEREVDAKVPDPTEAELQALYIVQKESLKRPFAELRPQLFRLLKQAKLQQARGDYYQQLREQAGVSILLQKPRVEVAHDPGRLRGSPNAALVIVEFGDFQCPYCRAVQPALKQLLAKYDGVVSLSYRDLPMRDGHPQAQSAAEAARCAGDQGKFWEYHDVLFDNPGRLHRDGLLEHARRLGLDEPRFEACLSGAKYRAQVEQDRLLGMRAGVTGTPGFVIDGNVLTGNLPFEAFDKAVQEAMAARQRR